MSKRLATCTASADLPKLLEILRGRGYTEGQVTQVVRQLAPAPGDSVVLKEAAHVPDPPIGPSVEGLATPCLLVDVERLPGNITRMTEMARADGVALRPHIKTHQVPAIAHMHMPAGATGINVPKVGEAKLMWAGGLRHIFIAYPVIGADKARRVAARMRQGCRLIVGVESNPGARFLSGMPWRKFRCGLTWIGASTLRHGAGLTGDARCPSCGPCRDWPWTEFSLRHPHRRLTDVRRLERWTSG